MNAPQDSSPSFNSATNDRAVLIALIDASSKLFWPILACWALLIFKDPISTALSAAARQIDGGGASVEIAGLKIILPKSAIPTPTDDVKAVLPKILPPDVDFIIANVGGDNTLDICYQDKELAAFDNNSVFVRLKELELITFERETLYQGGKPCLAGSKTTYKPLYNSVRSYLIRVLKAVTFNS